MIIVHYTFTDNTGKKSKDKIKLKNLEIVKHIIVAGSGSVPSIRFLKKAVGVLLFYEDYFPQFGQTLHFFPEPKNIWAYDPTSKAQFSNLVGKTMASIFFERCCSGLITFNYEAVMKQHGIPIKGQRPDLYGISKSCEYYAIEAKGFTTVTGKRQKHKQQANSGKLYKDYSIASVTENIYSNINVDFYDPMSDKIFDKPSIEDFVENYYNIITDDLNSNIKELRSFKKYGKDYIIITEFEFKGELLYLAVDSIISQGMNFSSLLEMERIVDEHCVIGKDGIGIFFAKEVENKIKTN